MFKYWMTGDIHRNVTVCARNFKLRHPHEEPDNTCIICLGDYGINLGGKAYEEDQKLKQAVSSYGYHWLILRGNHELRPSQVPNMKRVYDEELQGYIWFEEEFPLIRYFDDCVAEYVINGYSVLTVPGAFSIDKYYRLANRAFWNPEEQLTKEEMAAGLALATGKSYDFIFSHTCPISIEPRDLFLSMVRQEDVDKTMENYLETIIKVTSFKLLCFGHYHDDRLERPWAQMFYYNYEALDDIYERIVHPRNEPDYYHKKSPNYYMEDN